MTSIPTSLLLTDLTWTEVRHHLDHDQRVIVPVGACDQYGPHLVLGASILVAKAFARQLSNDFGVLHAPALTYGVNTPSERTYAGTASLREKTLHAAMNDLLLEWADGGFTEFILLTVHDDDAHVEALATITGTEARIRVIELLNMDFSSILTSGRDAEHGGEILTSLMLYLHPDKVRMERAVDHLPAGGSHIRNRSLKRIPRDSPGSIGRPTLASSETGRLLYDFIYDKIRTRVFSDVA